MYQVISKATERSFKRKLERKLRIIVETSEKMRVTITILPNSKIACIIQENQEFSD